MALVYVGLGSNMGDRQGQISKAIDQMRSFAQVKKISTMIETKPHGVVYVEPKFMNAVVELETSLQPKKLLEELMRIESEMGRRRTDPGAPREIDLDILSYADQVLATRSLTIPHPRIQERKFVMKPLAEVNPDWVHPVSKLSVLEMLSSLPDSE